MKKSHLSIIGLLSLTVLLPDAFAQNYFSLEPLTSFGGWGDGSIRTGDQPWVTTGNAQRGLAYNPASGNLIFVDRATGNASANFSGAIYVLNGITGVNDDANTLSNVGIQGGTFAHFASAVAEDGLIYVGNVVTDGTASQFKLYRWFGDFNGGDPVVVYSGDPGNGFAQRWGDTMDIRGQGTGTQIILGSRAVGTTNGTRVAILTTADGNTFTATTLTLDATDNATSGGIAFGAGATFWAKNLDTPLRQFSFNLGTGQATTLRSYGSDVLPSSGRLEALAVDTGNNLLALLNTPSGPDSVRLYDISNPSRAPSLLDIHDFIPNNANATTTKGYLDFGNANLYIHDINNGLLGLAVSSSTLIAPILATQPASQRLLAGKTLRLEVIAYPLATYQWQRNGANIPGGTNAVYNIASAQTSDAGAYRVIVSNSAGSTISDEAAVSVINPADLFHLEPLWSAVPTAGAYVTASGGAGTPNERHIGYNALSNQLYVVQRSGNNYTIHVIDASTGTKLYNLKTNGILAVVQSEVSGANGIGLVAIDVGDDGAIYACNASPNAGGGVTAPSTNKLFRVYRWANSDSNTLPVQIFEGDPAGQTSSNFRWGDVLDARGSGLGTQILLDNQNTTARYMAILRPTDETMTAFTSTFFFQDTATPFGGSIGRTLDFGVGDTLWQKRRSSALIQSGFDLNAPEPRISPVLNIYGNFPASLGPVGVDESRNILAGINFVSVTTTPDTLDLYDMSDPTNPLLLAQYNFPINHVANNNSIGRVLFAGDRVFALNGNNGLLAFRVRSGPVSPPTILSQPRNLRLVEGASGELSVITADIATFQWQRNEMNISGATNSTYPIAFATMTHAGSYRVIVMNDAGATTSAVVVVTIEPAANFHRLAQIWSAAPMSQPYVTTNTSANTPNERTIAYNALSNHLYVAQKIGGVFAIYVVDADNGALLYNLSMEGVAGNPPDFSGSTGIALAGIDVGDDGVIYACNMTADACGCANPAGVFRLYRWGSADPTIPAIEVFTGDPAGQTQSLRWGDVLDVRGAGTGTEILIDNNQGTFGAVLTPTDGSLTAFTSSSFPNPYGSGFIGRSLEFGSGNTAWLKRKGARLQLIGYDLSAHTSTVVTNYDNFPASLGAVAVDTARNLVAGIDFSPVRTSPDTVNLYDVSDFNNPLLIATYSFPENSRANANFIGQILIAGNRVFAINGNNGLIAFTIVPPGGSRPTLTIARSGSNVMLSWPASANDYSLQGTLSLATPNWMSVGTPVQSGSELTVTDNASSGNKFYRLCKGCP